jgi:eukaryotic-like serine/threonine-protein kinase
MAKKSAAVANFWRSDWVIALAMIFVLFFVYKFTNLIEFVDNKIYDSGMRAVSRQPNDQIAIIKIDEKSLQTIGRWPWSRDVHAKLIDKLAAVKPKVVAYNVLFPEAQIDKGAAYLLAIKKVLASSDPASNPQAAELQAIIARADADSALNADGLLEASLTKSGRVLLGTSYKSDGSNAQPGEVPNFLRPSLVSAPGLGYEVHSPDFPIPALATAAAGLGGLVQILDNDGTVRQEPLLLQMGNATAPSMALLTAAKSLGFGASDVRFNADGRSVQIGSKLRVGTDEKGRLLPLFYNPPPRDTVFPTDSFFDVLSGVVPASKFAGKIVIVGASAAGTTTVFPVPTQPEGVAPVEQIAHVTSSILSEHFIKKPDWGSWLAGLLLVGIGCYLLFFASRLKAGASSAVFVVVFFGLLITEYVLMSSSLTWIPLAAPAILMLLGYIALVSKRFFVTEKGKEKADSSSAESNRMLALTFQGQGNLDQAYDKFRSVPFSDALMDNLYNLALDFERKRQFNKAQNVYEHMCTYDKTYKDLAGKLARAKTMSETVIFGGSSGKGPGVSIVSADGSIEKPLLGRYQIEKELGKGAMGIVYLGKDPKIGRLVAIKTMALAQEFEGEELDDARERFFREAETAGRLQHPQIVTIYDTGEAHDLAYIAMELLKGQDLVPYCKAGALLPMEQVVSIVARVADALNYAHQQNVVHRDIKPANVMYDLEKDVAKVTDFGIARITDSSKTKTGIVLGTPSFMSPEQISGAKVDGRSDLYSLTVMLYQMLTGRLPFVGESMAELMYKIANAAPIDPREVRPDIPEDLAQICLFGMAKKPESRYQTGQQMEQDLKRILGTMQGGRGAPGSVDLSF